ncbi:MAG: hypothetical protein AW08_01796 [Candidatus Accumulibacter adjunctus]|uniref:Uncharacterized protein n=1 Tax=Candidatus Accumulibacter adjunctus TaxID=1454001 RepID=A0A011NTK1_9PROT|nr:MAG: hypothetical protein AW08_01796 [Candidatus Accumulibacter adjunctus]
MRAVTVRNRLLEVRARCHRQRCGGDGVTTGPGPGLIIDRDATGAGVVEPDGGRLVVGRCRRHRGVVARRPEIEGKQCGVPALVVGPDVAREEVHLHGLVGRHAAADVDATIDEVRLPLAQRDRGFEAATRILVDLHRGPARTGHDVQAGVLEHLAIGRVRDVRADRDAILRSPALGIEDLDRTRQQRVRTAGPANVRQSDALRRRDLVTPVEIDDRLQGSRLHGAIEYDDRSRIDHVSRIAHHPGRGTVADVPITPDLRTARVDCAVEIIRVGNIDVVAVFPLVVVDDRVVRRGRDGNVGLNRIGRIGGAGSRLDRLQTRQQLIFRKWHVEELDWSRIRAISERRRRRLARRHVIGRSQLAVRTREDRLCSQHQRRVQRTLGNHPGTVDERRQRVAVGVETGLEGIGDGPACILQVVLCTQDPVKPQIDHLKPDTGHLAEALGPDRYGLARCIVLLVRSHCRCHGSKLLK